MDDCGPLLIADDDADFRDAVAALLERTGYDTSRATTGQEALAAARAATPCAVILDVHLPEISGYEVCRELRDEFGESLPIIFVSGHRTEQADRVAGLIVGADEYLAKPVASDELLARVRRLVARSRAADTKAVLTEREREVLRLVAAGYRRAEVARKLFISPKTVEKHLERSFRKLGVHTQAQAVALALRHRYIEPAR